jgi:hypothetical protein
VLSSDVSPDSGVLFVRTEVFTPYLGGFVQVQRKELADVIAKINAEEVC